MTIENICGAVFFLALAFIVYAAGTMLQETIQMYLDERNKGKQ